MSNEADLREALDGLYAARDAAARNAAMVGAVESLDRLVADIAAAEARGFARAREQAAEHAECYGDTGARVARGIRSMKEG